MNGARPDVADQYPLQPFNTRAGWGYQLLTNALPAGGNGSYTLRAVAIDDSGNLASLGSRMIPCSNATATKPFGTIDTPAPGQIISGTAFRNWAWALTPQP